MPANFNGNQRQATSHINADGIVHVLTEDLGDSNEQHITITLSMVYSKHSQKEVEIRNQANSLVQSTEKTIKEVESRFDKSKTNEMKSAMEKVKEALKGEDINKINSTVEEHSKSSQDLFDDNNDTVDEGNEGD